VRRRPPVALTIAGSDPSGGAGIQADLKTFHAFGCYGEAVLTALTAQNTLGVTGVHPVPAPFVVEQIERVLEDIPPDATKTGMLANRRIIASVAALLRERRVPNLVVDPVMVSTSGHRLLDRGAERAMLGELVPLAAVVTPNGPEAEVLTGIRVRDVESAVAAGQALVAAGAKAALVKDGHGRGPRVRDVLVTADGGWHSWNRRRLRTRSTHGTGCTLSAALAASLAEGTELLTATILSMSFVHRAIARAPGLGRGHGPVDHHWTAPRMKRR